MLPARPSARILALRPLRPPSATPSPRVFTQNSQLLLIASHTPRPQLPYLSQPHLRTPARLLSTETKAQIKEQIWLVSRYTVIGWSIFFLASIAYTGFEMEYHERENPTPSDWGWRTRSDLRTARMRLSREWAKKVGFVDWAKTADVLRELLWKLESPDYEGKGIELVGKWDDREELLEGVSEQLGKEGFDISNKSWEWRSGYFEVVMALGRAAEHLEHHVRDKTQNKSFPKSMVKGPSNPDRRPTPSYMGETPREENCTKAIEDPDVFYMRILTGIGFTTEQRMEAASAYANWLDIKGLKESAEEQYKWELDIAKSALPPIVEPESVIDSQTAVLKSSGEAIREITPNLLRASTDLAVHYARTGNVSAALPIFLSILRARRLAPLSPYPPLEEKKPERSWLSMLSPTPFPPPPPSGDEPYIRFTDTPTCKDGELMLYIGEILFATSPQSSDEGMGWTRQAVSIAEENLSSTSDDDVRCKECLLTGVQNWDAMLQRATAKLEAEVPAKGWFGYGGNKRQLEDRAWDILEQQRRVAALKEKIVREGIDRAVSNAGNTNPSGRWIS